MKIVFNGQVFEIVGSGGISLEELDETLETKTATSEEIDEILNAIFPSENT